MRPRRVRRRESPSEPTRSADRRSGWSTDPELDQYDRFADLYQRIVEAGVPCAEVERPAIRRMLGPVGGREILDAACGTGPLMEVLGGDGAHVSGFDGSEAMIERARRRLGPSADLRVHDLRAPLPYGDCAFDAVVCSLALHYVRRWGPVLGEFRRVVRGGGSIVISTHHPLAVMEGGEHRYLETAPIDDVWDLDGARVPIRYWRRPLEAMATEAELAGLAIGRIREPGVEGSGLPRFLVLLLHPHRRAGVPSP